MKHATFNRSSADGVLQSTFSFLYIWKSYICVTREEFFYIHAECLYGY